jgi:hypothetical protein
MNFDAHQEEFTFKPSSVFKHRERVHNVVPGDFTQNGKLDLLVMSQSQSANQLNMYLYLARSQGGLSADPLSLPASTLSQPIPFDMNGDLKIDMLGIPASSANDLAPFRVWKNVWNASQPQGPLFTMYAIRSFSWCSCFTYPTVFRVNPTFEGSQCKISNPHSNAFVDLNGDCLAGMIWFDIFSVTLILSQTSSLFARKKTRQTNTFKCGLMRKTTDSSCNNLVDCPRAYNQYHSLMLVCCQRSLLF